MLAADNDLLKIEAIHDLGVREFLHGVSFLIEKSKLNSK
jgi:hypothetical protein